MNPKIAPIQEIIFSKDAIGNLFITNKIIETNFAWMFNNHKIDIIALHPKEIKYIENLHKTDKYKIVYKD